MTYEINFSNQATKFIRNLQSDIRERVKTKFREIAENPYRFTEHYEGDYHKIRIGQFRALVDIDTDKMIIWVRIFDKRSRIYER